MLNPKNNFYPRFKEFLKSPAYYDDMWEREEKYGAAINLINSEEKINKLTIENIFSLLRLFHSGGVERHRNKIASEIDGFKKLILATFTICQDKSGNAFEKAKIFLDTPEARVAGAGRNVVSELFHTYDPVRFPILNKNFEEGLLYFGFIIKLFKGSFGEKYYQCIKLAQEIRENFKIESCQLLDCFSNYIYWENKKKYSPEEYQAWIRRKRQKKKRYLKISDKTMETFEIEFLPVQQLPDKVIKALQAVLVSYDKASLSSFGTLSRAYQITAKKVRNKQLLEHKTQLLKESAKHTLFTGSRLNHEQLKIYEKFVKIFLDDVKKSYLL